MKERFSGWRVAAAICGAAPLIVSAFAISGETNRIRVPQSMANQDGGGGSSVLRDAIRLQEVYSASLFPTQTIVIHELRWRPSAVYGSPFTNSCTRLQINLSTVLKQPGLLSSTFSANVGGDDTVVFDGPIELKSRFTGSPGSPKEFDIVVPLSAPFTYNPEYGNLLVDVRNHFASAVTFVDAGLAGGKGSRVFSLDPNSTTGASDAGTDALEVVFSGANSSPPPPPANIVRGPYLQSLSTSNVIVRWRTDRIVRGSVRFGLETNALETELSEEFPTTDHAVTVENLQPGTRYFYAIHSGTNSVISGIGHHFTTHPQGQAPVRIWAIGDSGTASLGGTAPMAIRDAYQQFSNGRKTDVWLMLGDNAYYAGTDAEYQLAVFNVFEDLLRTTAVWSTLGNHETYSPDLLGRIAYTDIFSFPQDGRSGGVASGTERYYSFNYANVHFVCLDSEVSDRSAGSPMLSWLEQDLAANTLDWTIAYWHSPPYSRGSHNSDLEANLVQMRQNVLPVLESFGVDLVLCGHSHSYERSHLLNGHYGNSMSLSSGMVIDPAGGRSEERGAYLKGISESQPGTVYVVAGSAGQTSGGALNHPAMFISLNRLGSMVIDVETNRLEAKFLRETGEVDDHFTVLKGDYPPSIVSAPSDKSVFAGQSVVFTVKAVGMSPLSYQWYLNQLAIPEQTNSILVLTNVGFDAAGFYTVQVSNSLGSIVSSNAALAVTVPLQCDPITVPHNLVATEGGGGSSVLRDAIRLQEVYSASLFPARPMVIRELRWRPSAQYSSAFTGTIARLQINLSTTLKSPGGLSSVFAQNVGADDTVVRDGPIELQSVFLGLPQGPKAFDIIVPLSMPFVYDPADGNLLVDIRNHTGGAVKLVDAGLTAGMGSRVFALGAGSTSGIGDGGADAIQFCASVAGSPRPQILTAPVAQAVLVGGNANFTVEATGSLPLSFQWYQNGIGILGATNSTLVLENVLRNQAGDYFAVVANTFGAVTSAVAALTVSYPAATFAIGNSVVSSGGTIELPVQFDGNGIETLASFSVVFDPSRITFDGVIRGDGLPLGSSIVVTTNHASLGRVGFEIVAPSGGTFLGASHEMIRIRYFAVAGVAPSTSSVEFGDDPVQRRLEITAADPVAANYFGGSITIIPSLVKANDATAIGGSVFTASFDLVSLGTENAIGFSVSFDSTILIYDGAEIGNASPIGGALLVNTNLASSGYLGVAIALPAGISYERGTQQLVGIRFRTAGVLNPVETSIKFGNLPIPSQISDAAARSLAAAYRGSVVRVIPSPLEADVIPRPDGDRETGIVDWVQAGRFAAGLDEVSMAEFQRADCAPRSTLGNGVVSVADWVQAGRYSAGLDPATGVGGPSEPAIFSPAAAFAGTGCEIRITNTNVLPGSILNVPVVIVATGAENALGFSVTFDSSRLRYRGATALPAAHAATINLNTNQIASGRLGIALALPLGSTLSAGTREFFLLSFEAPASVSGSTTLSFGDSPVVREVVNVTASSIPCTFAPAEITLGSPAPVGPVLSIARSGENILLHWSASEVGFDLYSSESPRDAAWTKVTVVPLEIGGQKLVTLPRVGGEKYFRLRKP